MTQVDSGKRSGKRVLIVEDDEFLAELLGVWISSCGFDVTVCNHGVQALEALKLQSFSVVLVDFMMPVLDGIALVKQMRALAYTQPVVILSASADFSDENLVALGVVDCLQKPLDENSREQLINVLTHLVTP